MVNAHETWILPYLLRIRRDGDEKEMQPSAAPASFREARRVFYYPLTERRDAP